MTANSRSPVYGAVDIGFPSTTNCVRLGNPRFDLDHALKRGLGGGWCVTLIVDCTGGPFATRQLKERVLSPVQV